MSREEADALLRRCGSGDQAAFAEIAHSFQSAIYRLAHRVSANPALADEAVLATLEKVWAKATQWRGESSASTWIYRLAVRTVLDIQRGQRRWWRRLVYVSRYTKVETTVDPSVHLGEIENQELRAREIQAAIATLSEEDRLLVHLHYFESLSLADIEPILNASRDALKMRLARARQKLRKILDPSNE